MANVISLDKRVAVIKALVEGCSVLSTVRMTGVSRGAVLRLLASVGQACIEYRDRVIRNGAAKRVQVDEIWSFVGRNQENVTEANDGRLLPHSSDFAHHASNGSGIAQHARSIHEIASLEANKEASVAA